MSMMCQMNNETKDPENAVLVISVSGMQREER
jgi:hypothetical protein